MSARHHHQMTLSLDVKVVFLWTFLENPNALLEALRDKGYQDLIVRLQVGVSIENGIDRSGL